MKTELIERALRTQFHSAWCKWKGFILFYESLAPAVIEDHRHLAEDVTLAGKSLVAMITQIQDHGFTTESYQINAMHTAGISHIRGVYGLPRLATNTRSLSAHEWAETCLQWHLDAYDRSKDTHVTTGAQQ